MQKPSTVAEIMDAIALELDLSLAVPKIKESIIWWLNVIYPLIVEDEEYSWRKKDINLYLHAPIETNNIRLAKGSNKGMVFGGINGGKYIHAKRAYLKLPDYTISFPLKNFETPMIFELESEFPYDNYSGTGVFYCSRYEIEAHDDWILGVSIPSLNTSLRRIYPSAGFELEYNKTNAGTPTSFYTKGASSTNYTLLNILPAPQSNMEAVVNILLGAEKLTYDTPATIIPPPYDKLLLVYGTCYLYSLSHKDIEGMQMYDNLFNQMFDKLKTKSGKNPGSRTRLLGYAASSINKGWDRNLPLPTELDFK